MSRGMNTLHTPASWWRCLLVWALTSLGCGPAAALCGQTLLHDAHPGAWLTLDQLLVRVAAGAGLLSVTWIWLITSTTTLAAARGRVPVARGPVQRLVLAACGAALVLSSGAPALAAGGDPDEASTHANEVTSTTISGLPYPDRAVDSPTAGPRTRGVGATTGRSPTASPPTASPATANATPTPPTPTRAEPAVRVVRQGDSLWALAAEPSATDGARSSLTATTIDARWRAIYRANRAVIGPDPDLIRPGQRLVIDAPQSQPQSQQGGQS